MKIARVLSLLTVLMLTSSGTVRAQNPNNAYGEVENLRTQLSEVQYKEAELKVRLQQLDYDLKPENIERYFTGYGSTRPEELREARRRELQIEKDLVVSQLEQLTSAGVRLTAAITDAQAKAYLQSAQSAAVMQPDQDRRAKVLTTLRSLGGIVAVVTVLGSLLLYVAIRRRVIVRSWPPQDLPHPPVRTDSSRRDRGA